MKLATKEADQQTDSQRYGNEHKTYMCSTHEVTNNSEERPENECIWIESHSLLYPFYFNATRAI